MNSNPLEKIEMIRRSQWCLACGLLALLPAIGLPFAVGGLVLAGKIREQERELWNPARPYRIIAVACALAGTVGWLLVGAFIAFLAISDHA